MVGNNKMPDFNKIWNILAVGDELIHAERRKDEYWQTDMTLIIIIIITSLIQWKCSMFIFRCTEGLV